MNIITRGLGAIHKLLTRGYGGVTTVDSPSGGSVTGLIGQKPRYVAKYASFNVDGIKLFKESLLIFLKGILAFYNSSLYNIMGTVKRVVDKLFNIKAIYAFGILQRYTCSAIAKYSEVFKLRITAILKLIINSKVLFTATSSFYRGKQIAVSSIIKFNQLYVASCVGVKKLYTSNKIIINGKRNIINILTALGLLDNKE